MRTATATPPPPSGGTIERTWRVTVRSTCRSAPAAGAARSTMIDAIVTSRMRLTGGSGRQCLRRLRRREHPARVVSDAGQFDQTPVELPAAGLCQRLRRVEYVHSALVARCTLGQRLGIIVALVITGIALAEIDGQGLFQVAPQGRLAIRSRIDLSQPVGRVDLEAGKHVASRVCDHDTSCVGGHEGGEAVEELGPCRVAEPEIGAGPSRE